MADFGGSFGGSSAGAMYLRLTLDSAGYQQKLNQAKTQTVTSTSAMGKEYTRLGTIAKQALGAIGAVELIRRSIAAYDEQTKAVARLNVAFGNSPALAGASTASFIEQASALSRLTGVQDEQIISAQAALTVFGLTEDQLARITPLVVDYAAFTGTDVTSAAASMGRAVLGNARALKTIGIDFKRTGDSAKDFETIMSLVASKVGGTAEKMATPMDHLKVAANEAFESIGKGLAPALEAVSGIIGVLPPQVLAVAVAIGVLNFALDTTLKRIVPLTAAFAVGFAIGDWIAGTHAATEEANRWGDAIARVSGNLHDLVPDSAIDDLGEMIKATRDGSVSMDEFTQYLEDFNRTNDTSFKADNLLKMDSALSALAGSADNARRAVGTFAGMTGEELATWEEGAAASFNLVMAKMDELSGKAHLTVAGVIKAFKNAVSAQINYQKNFAAVAQAVMDDFGVQGDEFVKDVQKQGPEVSRVFAAMAANHRKAFDKIVNDYLRARVGAETAASGVDSLQSSINGLHGKTVVISADTGNAYAQVISIVNAVNAIPAYKIVHIYADVAGGAALREGGIAYGAAGLITRGPTMIRPGVVAGEANYSTPWGKGAEAVTPLNAQGRKILAEAVAMAMRENGVGGSNTINVNGASPQETGEYVLHKLARMARFS